MHPNQHAYQAGKLVEYTIVRCIKTTLEGHVAFATLNDISLRFAISTGCPQGGVLLPLVWCLVVDDLITRLSESGVFIQGYADDMSSRGG
jgi:hypothetical protein